MSRRSVDPSAIEWTSDTASAAIQNMSVNHGHADNFEAKLLFDNADVEAVFQEVG